MGRSFVQAHLGLWSQDSNPHVTLAYCKRGVGDAKALWNECTMRKYASLTIAGKLVRAVRLYVRATGDQYMAHIPQYYL